MWFGTKQSSYALVVRSINNVIGEIDEELGQAALGSGIVAENRRESSISKRLR